MRRPVHVGVVLACLAGVGVSLAPATAAAQLQFTADKPRVFAIQPRPYRLGHEFELSIGVLPLDAFYVGMVIGASYTYHFTDFWAWEIAGAGYSLNINTGLQSDLKNRFGVEPVRGGGERIRFFGSTGLVIKPLFGKLALWNEDIIYSETFFTLGVGPFMDVSADGAQTFWRAAVNVGLGFRFWSSEVLSFRFDVRDYIVFKQAPENDLLFQLGAALNVFNGKLVKAPTWPPAGPGGTP